MSNHQPSSIEFDAQRHSAGHRLVEAALLTAGAVLLDSAPGIVRSIRDLRSSGRTLPDPFVSEMEGSNRAIVLYTGCDQLGEEEGQHAAKLFGDIGHVIVPIYDRNDMSPAKVADQVTSTAHELGVDEIVIIGNSIGLSESLQVSAESGFRTMFPKVSGYIGNAGVTERADIAPGARKALRAAEITGYSTLIDTLYPKLPAAELSVGPMTIKLPKRPGMKPSELLRYGRAVAAHLPDGVLKGLVDPGNAWYVDNQDKLGFQDQVVYTKRGRRNMGRVLGVEAQLVEDLKRPAGVHRANLRYPEPVRELILHAFGNDAPAELRLVS